jgi:Amidases related to nicotinamidase
MESVPRPVGDYIVALTEEFAPSLAETALIIVDLQYATASWEAGLGRICRDDGRTDQVQWRLDRVDQLVIPNVRRLLAAARASGMNVLYITTGAQTRDFRDVPVHYRSTLRMANNRRGTHEHEIRDEVAPREDEIVINKTTISAFGSSGIGATLRALGVEYAVFCGVSTNTCVDATARDAAERGYRSIVVSDACSAAQIGYHEAALVNFQRLFGRVETTAGVLDLLGLTARR